MAEWVKTFAIKPENPSLTPRPCMLERENYSSELISCPHELYDMALANKQTDNQHFKRTWNP